MALYGLLTVAALALMGYAVTPRGRSVFFRRFAGGTQLQMAYLMVFTIIIIALVALIVIHHATLAEEVAVFAALAACFALIVALLRNRIASPPKTATPYTVLTVGAHPDDLEIACGGTLARLADEGHKIHAIVMSDGCAGGDNSVRPTEARNGAATMGLEKIEIHSLTDTRLEDHNMEMVDIIEAKVNELKPDLILTHSSHDQHQDHKAVHFAVLRAARKQPSILCFESPSVTSEFNPQLFIDITNYIDIKIHAVQDHRDQAGKRYLRWDRLKGMANFRGAQGKLELAEGFEIVRLKDSIAGLK